MLTTVLSDEMLEKASACKSLALEKLCVLQDLDAGKAAHARSLITAELVQQNKER